MVIERPDDYTILYMGQKGNALFDIVAVRSHLKQIVESGFDIESSLGSVSSNGHLTRELLHEALESCGLHPQELITLDHEFTDKQNDIW